MTSAARNTRELKQFLVGAKRNTYASQGEGQERRLDDGSAEFVYEAPGFIYKHRYWGFNPFIGHELVWQDGHIVWAMNYYGRTTSNLVSEDKVFAFLRPMKQVDEDPPFRGPNSLRADDFEYRDESLDTVESFTGVERILWREREIFRLDYHGRVVRMRP